MTPNDSNTRLLVHFEEDPPIDDSFGGIPKTLECNGTLSSAQAKFGGQALYCYGVGNDFRVLPSFDWRFGSGPFTIDGWFYPLADPYLFCLYRDAANFLAVEVVRTQGAKVILGLRLRVGGVEIAHAEGSALTTMLGGWHHIAVMRYQHALSLWLDGDAWDGDTLPSPTYPIDMSRWSLYVGRSLRAGQTALRTMHGYVDEFRVAAAPLLGDGGAVASVSFSVATAPYAIRWRRTVRGISPIRAGQKRSVQGRSNIAQAHFRRAVQGGAMIRAATARGVGGHSHVRAETVRAVQGYSSIAGTSTVQVHRYRRSPGGLSLIRAAQQRAVQGQSQILDTTFRRSVQGISTVWQQWRRAVQGLSTIHRRWRRGVQGTCKIQATATTYALYYGDGSPPDLTAAPWETFSSLPHESAAISGAGLHYFVLRQLNVYGFESQNLTSWVVELDDSDNQIRPVPAGPIGIAIAPAAGGKTRVTARYLYLGDQAAAADQWLVYITDDGDDPDPEVDEPVVVTMLKSELAVHLDWLSAAADHDDTIKVLVRCRRSGTGGRDSTNSGIVSTTASTAGPAAPSLRVFRRHRATIVEAV